jgi:hypothetical protein
VVLLQAETWCGMQQRSEAMAVALLYSCDGEKLPRGHTLGSFIGERVLAHAERYPKSILQLNQRMLQNLLWIRLDLILGANSQRHGDKALGMTRRVGVLDDHKNVSQCGILLVERCGTRAKVPVDGSRQASSRGRVGMAPGYTGVNPGQRSG